MEAVNLVVIFSLLTLSLKLKGHVYDAKLAVGYQFKLCDDSFAIAPLVGWSWHGQHLQDRHLRQSFFCSDDYRWF